MAVAARSPPLRACLGEIVFVPARVTAVGEDKRSIRLCIDTGASECIAVKPSPDGNNTFKTGHVHPEMVYNAHNSMHRTVMEKVALSATLDSISAELQTLGHTKEQADVMAMAAPWIRSLCFTDATKIHHMAATIISASAASMRLTLNHATKSDFKAAGGVDPKTDAASLLTAFGKATELDRELWEHDLPPSKWPAGMIASGLVPEEHAEFPF